MATTANTGNFAGITIALSKGRIFDETLPLLAAAGLTPQDDPEKSRKLIIATNNPGVRLVIVRASDVPTYVQYGAGDLGVAWGLRAAMCWRQASWPMGHTSL